MTKSDPYQELFHAMAKTPAIPEGLTMIGSDVGRVVGSAPTEQPHPMSCGDVGNVMPEVENSHKKTVSDRFAGQCYVAKAMHANIYLVIVPARDSNEAAVGSGILSIGRTEAEAWKKAAE